MESRYPPPPPPYYPSTQRFSYAPYPPPSSYYGRYPSDHGSYYYSRPSRASLLPWGQESATSHYSFPSYRPPKDPFLEREYERERIREEVLREEARRRIIEEEVRWELQMEHYYNYRHSNQGYYKTWRNVQFEQPRFSHGCHTRGPRGQIPNKRPRRMYGVTGVQHKIMEIDEEELLSKTLVSGDKAKPSSKEEIQKKKDEQTVQTEVNGNKVDINFSEIPHKITEVDCEEIRRPQALLKDKVQSPKNQEELRLKASLPDDALTSDKMKPTTNTIGVEYKGDGKRVLKADGRTNAKQSASSSKAPLPEKALPKDMMKPLPGIENEGDGNTVPKPDSENKVEQSSSSKSSLPEEALPKDKMKLLPNRDVIEKNGNGNKVLKPGSEISPEEGSSTPRAHPPTEVEIIDLDPEDEVEQFASSKAPLPEEALCKDKMKLLTNINNIEKNRNGNKVLKPDSGIKVEQPASSKASLPEKNLSKDKIKPASNRIGIAKEGAKNMISKPETANKVERPKPVSSKAPFPKEAVLKDKMKLLTNRNGIEKNGNGNKVLNPDSGNKVEQPASSKAPLPENDLPKDKMKPVSNRIGIEKEGAGNTIFKPETGNKVEQPKPVSSKAPFPEEAVPKEKMKLLPDRSSIDKNRNGNIILKPDSGNKVKQPASSKAPLPEEALPKDKMKPLSDRNGIAKEGHGNKVLKPDTGNKVEQSQSSKTHVLLQIPMPAALESLLPYPPSSGPPHQKGPQTHFLLQMPTLPTLGSFPLYPPLSWPAHQKGLQGQLPLQMPTLPALRSLPPYPPISGPAHQKGQQKLTKAVETCGSKRKSDSISAVPTPTATSSSSDKVGPKKVKKQKVEKKEYSCTFCQLTVYDEHSWQGHLNGKRHRNSVRKRTNVEKSKKASSVTDNKSTSGTVLPSVKVEMDNGDSLPTKPTAEESQADKGIIRQMQVGREVHKVVEKNNRLWCERCRYNCNTVVMMTIHLVSEKHKSNCQKK